jgi:hypothetical protein
MLERKRQILTSVFYFAAALLLASLGRFSAVGLSSRYWADDYCYSAVFATGGFLRGPVDWFLASGNRFSTIYLAGLQDLFGPWAIRFIPGLILLVLSTAWLAFLLGAARALGARPDIFVLLPLALTQVFFLVLLTPDRLQTLYWRMGTLHYTFPLALLLFNLALILNKLLSPGRGWRLAVGLFILAFFAGGFSETFAALQVGAYALASAAVVVFLPRAMKRNAAARILPALLGSLAAIGLMLLSPSNAWRQAALPPPDNLGEFLGYTLRYTLDFTRDILRGYPLPLLALVLLSGACAYPVWVILPRPPSPQVTLTAAGLFLLAGLALSACAIAPSVYAGLQFPAGRALMPALFALLFGLAGAAACLAALPRVFTVIGSARINNSLLADLLLIFALLSGSFYVGRQLSFPLPEQTDMAVWAQRWDERDASIQGLQAAGKADLVLRETEVVRGLEDLGADPTQWVNRCAAAYYRVHSITALP